MIRNTIFILLGPPGSGKGTLSSLCVQQFGWLQLSTGNLCRDNIAQNTALGLKIKAFIEQGLLVPDEIIAEMVADWLTSQDNLPKGVLFDGYPRTKVQAAILYDLLQTKLQTFDVILVKVGIDPALLIERIVNRVICSNKNCGRVYSLLTSGESSSKQPMICDDCGSALIRRVDDTAQSLEQRLRVYFQHEQDIIDFYVDKGLPVCTLNGAQAIQNVFEDFKKIALHDHGC